MGVKDIIVRGISNMNDLVSVAREQQELCLHSTNHHLKYLTCRVGGGSIRGVPLPFARIVTNATGRLVSTDLSPYQ